MRRVLSLIVIPVLVAYAVMRGWGLDDPYQFAVLWYLAAMAEVVLEDLGRLSGRLP